MLIRNSVLMAALTVSGIPTAFAEKAAPVLEMEAIGEIQIAPDGHVSDYRINSKLSPALVELVEKNVHGWQFEPVLVDGQPVVAKTAMRVRLKADPMNVKDNYKVSIVDVTFGEPKRVGKGKAPRYPSSAVGARLGAKVMLALKLDASGNVVDALPYQTSLDGRASSEVEADRWRREFEKASLVAARSWKYDLTETINGRSIGTNVLAPIEFTISDRPEPPSGWRAYIPGPVHVAPWMQADITAVNTDIAEMREGESLALDSRFHLKSDVIGKTL